VDKDIELCHEMFAVIEAQEAPFNDPIIRSAWRHGVIGTIAINEYIKSVAENDIVTPTKKL